MADRLLDDFDPRQIAELIRRIRNLQADVSALTRRVKTLESQRRTKGLPDATVAKLRERFKGQVPYAALRARGIYMKDDPFYKQQSTAQPESATVSGGDEDDLDAILNDVLTAERRKV